MGPEYEAILQDYQNHDRYVAEIDRVLVVTKQRLDWSENTVARYTKRISELEEKLQAQLISEGSEMGAVQAELEALSSRYKAVEEKLRSTKNELEQECKKSASAIAPEKLLATQNEVSTLQKENGGLSQMVSSLEAEKTTLQGEISNLQTRLQDQATKSAANQTREATNTAERRELEDELSLLRIELKSAQQESADSRALGAENTDQKNELERELSRLRIELKSAQNAYTTALEASGGSEKQLSHLRTEFKTESTTDPELENLLSRLHIELESTKYKSNARITLLENNLADTQRVLAAAEATLTELRGAPKPDASAIEIDLKADIAVHFATQKRLQDDFFTYVSNADERMAQQRLKFDAMRAKLNALRADVAAGTARVEPVAPVVPRMTMDDLGNSVRRPRKEAPKMSDLSLTPFFTKHAVVTTNSPLSPSAVVVGEDTAGDGDDTMIDRSMRIERSILIPSVIESSEPTRLLLAGANRKRKHLVKAAQSTAIPEESDEEEALPKPKPKKRTRKVPEESEEEEAPPKPQPKKRAKKVPEKAAPEPAHIFDTPIKEKVKPTKKMAPPTSIFDDEPLTTKPVPKKRKRPVGPSPAFREDDGTGRLVLAGDSAEPSSGSGLTLRPPVQGVFTKEISPPKKRPEVLKRFFAGGKKIQGRGA